MIENEIVIIETKNNEVLTSADDIYSARTKIVNSFTSEVEATIIINAFNQLDKVRNCVNSVIQNTDNVKYKLLLIDNGSYDDRLIDYFKSVNHEKKQIIKITNNMQVGLPMTKAPAYFEGNYIVFLNCDIIVTPNWLKNMIYCAESDPHIGMIVPLSSNISNKQGYDLVFSDLDDMYKKSKLFNVSDPRKWNERIRLITTAPLFRKECLDVIGSIFDPGFFHDFIDDDVTFRIRRAGYKAVLVKDTWVHHDHKNHSCSVESLTIGRDNFQQKYYSIDAWDDVNNYIPEILSYIQKTTDETCAILGIDVRCGTPILEVKNQLRQFDVFDAECCAATSDGKYFIDLQTVCGADNVVSCQPVDVSDYYQAETFDYIIIGENINEYPEPVRTIRNVYSLLKKGGRMFVYLKNTYDVLTLLNTIGYRSVRPEKFAYNISVDSFVEKMNELEIPAQVINVVTYSNIPEEYFNEVNKRIELFVKEEWSETSARLTADRFVIMLSKE